MKKIIIVVFLLNVSGVFAQNKLRLGVHLDPISTWFSPKTKGIEKDGARLGISGGLLMEYYFSQNYGLASGISITGLGGNLMYNDSLYISAGGENVLVKGGSTVAYNVTYLTIPLALKLKTNEMGFFTYFAKLGLNHHINIGSKASSSGSELSKDNVSEEINLFNLSYFFGGGLEYNLGGQTSLSFGLFYNHGFTDVLSNDDHKANLNCLVFHVGMFF